MEAGAAMVFSSFPHAIIHSFVPNQFRFGNMVPIIKDQSGNLTDVSNYRGITLSPVISKLFAHALQLVFSECLTSSAHQFGFKKNSFTTVAASLSQGDLIISFTTVAVYFAHF